MRYAEKIRIPHSPAARTAAAAGLALAVGLTASPALAAPTRVRHDAPSLIVAATGDPRTTYRPARPAPQLRTPHPPGSQPPRAVRQRLRGHRGQPLPGDGQAAQEGRDLRQVGGRPLLTRLKGPPLDGERPRTGSPGPGESSPWGDNPQVRAVTRCAPGRIRTCDTRFRRAVLYPLSYEGRGLVRPRRRPGVDLRRGRPARWSGGSRCSAWRCLCAEQGGLMSDHGQPSGCGHVPSCCGVLSQRPAGGTMLHGTLGTAGQHRR